MFGWFRRKETKREIIINAETLETRVAILDNGLLEEFQVEHPTEERIVGSVFKGKIQNLENDLQAAFVDIGLKKNAFLHYWDMVPDDELDAELDEDRRGRRRSGRKSLSNEEIAKRFAPGTDIVVQVSKGAIGTKGPRITASLSIPGKYLVLMPGSSLKGVSRKIGDDDERRRLKKMVMKLQNPPGVGIIVRTAASGVRQGALERDLEALLLTWGKIQQDMKEKKSPVCLFEEPDLVERVVRDWLTEDIDRIVIDSKDKYERIRDIAGLLSRSAKSKIHLYDGELSIFDHYNVEKEIEQTFSRKVMLKSGGYVIFDETEALIAVDVNTGRHKGKGSQEEAILAVNLEAVEEVARQLRLRNIGGLVVIDLIDMRSRKHQSLVFRAMKDALKKDHARTNVLQISELGIMEMTRQRVEESLLSQMYVDCPYCRGRANVKSPLCMSVDIQRQISAVMRRASRSGGPLHLQVVVHPTVLDRLRSEDEEILVEMESKFKGALSFKSDPSKHVEYFAINNAVTGDVMYSSMDR